MSETPKKPSTQPRGASDMPEISSDEDFIESSPEPSGHTTDSTTVFLLYYLKECLAKD